MKPLWSCQIETTELFDNPCSIPNLVIAGSQNARVEGIKRKKFINLKSILNAAFHTAQQQY